MNTFVTHPSVRIKGTEHNYNPMRCFDPRCPDHSIHMHCPFCVKRDFYHDPVILKAHFRVKHVDKGIDFAGLKILRCCDHCDIVGIIKGEKKFKGAHWHCYKCRNGFNRRDEAIKHYKTHFRNPQTTFQIQIAQEIHNTSSYDGTPVQSGLSIHPVLTQAVMSTSLAESHSLLNQHATKVNLSNGKSADGTLQVSVAANETVDTSDPSTPTHHIMIIQDEQGDNCERGFTTQIISSEDVGIAEEKEQAVHQNSDNQFEELLQKYQKLQEEKNQMESQLKAVIENLHCQIKVLKDKVKEGEDREKELVEQISVPLDKNIENLMQQLENQHRDLLHQQLLCIKRQYNVQSASSHGNVEICASSVDCPPEQNFVENKPDILPEVQQQENLTEVQDQRDLAEIQHQENLNEIQCHESLVEVQGDGNLTQKEHNPQYSGGTQIFTVVKNFDDSNDQIDQDNDHLESSGLDMEENEDTMKITSSAVDSGEKVVCINYSSLPIDNAGNFQVTHLELQKDDSCQDEVNSCPADDVEVPSPKRQKIV